MLINFIDRVDDFACMPCYLPMRCRQDGVPAVGPQQREQADLECFVVTIVIEMDGAWN